MGRVRFKFKIVLTWLQPDPIPGVVFDPLECHIEEVDAKNVDEAWRAIYRLVMDNVGDQTKRLSELEIRFIAGEEQQPWEKGVLKISWTRRMWLSFVRRLRSLTRQKTA